jgi:carboxyl-terminal processing protease
VIGNLVRFVAAGLIALCLFVAGVIVGGHPVSAGLTNLPDPVRGVLIGEAEGNVTSQVLRILDDEYFREIDAEQLDISSVDRVIASLDDPFTDYLTEEEYQALRDRNAGRYTGVGLQVAVERDRVVVVEVFEGGPAEKGGVKADDRIVRVDGVPVDPERLDATVGTIRGPEGTTVTLTLRRGNRPPFDVELTRAHIPLRLTTAETRTVDGTTVGWIHLRQFAQGAGDAVREEAEALVEAGASALVLDLRGNSGGLVTETVEVSGVFLDEGTVVVTTEGRSVEDKTLTTDEEPAAADLPLVVLVDAGSASASEIVAGALRDAGRARLVGHRTFGKALVQGTRPLRDGGALKLTIARYRTPSGQDINEKGLVPGIRVVDDRETPDVDEALERALGVAAEKAR